MELTTEDLCQIFDVGAMTVYNWRLASVRAKKTPLPFHTQKFGDERHKVFFKWNEVRLWAHRNGVQVVVHPNTL